ncbi:MAG: tannase/feruloyl esterase family alpha/beta hydrolase [Opitutaceae bacterium]|nr:tannase/feruloyl esterase family alpha/beta hydrolase [Opitutaceae bacterium]
MKPNLFPCLDRHMRLLLMACLPVLALTSMAVRAAETRLPALFPDVRPVCAPEDLKKLSLPNTTIDSVEVDPSGSHCVVSATVTHPPADDRVKVQVSLPLQGWNGRFRGTGGGGFYGGNPKNLPGPLALGYAVAMTDTGHDGGSANFALDVEGRLNWQLIRDNAYLGIHDMTVVGKALVKAFYGRLPGRSYFVGSSTGGRQGLMEAQRYPEDYDGIVSSSPAINWHRFLLCDLWPQVLMHAEGNLIPKEKLNAVTAAAIAACDGEDGVVDGVIDDPYRVTYDPRRFVGTKVAGMTFTEADASLVSRFWEGPRAYDGGFLWHGMALGTDLSSSAGTKGTPLQGRPFPVALNYLRYYLVQDGDWDWTKLTPARFELLFRQSVEQYGEVIGTDNPDLTAFRDCGGKIIILHGLADQQIPAHGTIDYYRRVQQRMGGAEETSRFARLFLAPGNDHGYRGIAPAPVDQVDALVRWVEEGVGPDQLLAERRDKEGKLLRSRPLYAYPLVARYKGSGSTDDAANFGPSRPKAP